MPHVPFFPSRRDPSAPRGTLRGNYRRSVLTIAFLAIALLSVLTVLFTWVSFRLQGEYLVAQLSGLAQSQLVDLFPDGAANAPDTSDPQGASAATGASAAADVSAATDAGAAADGAASTAADGAPSADDLRSRMAGFADTTVQYERLPGIPHLFGAPTAQTTIGQLARFRVLWQGTVLYEDTGWADEGQGLYTHTLPLAGLFRPLFDNEARMPFGPSDAGAILVRLVPDYWAARFGSLLLAMLVIAGLSVWLMLPFSRHFARVFSRPFAAVGNQLGKMADGDYQDALHTRIRVKRPLKELHAVVADANVLLDKMRQESESETAQISQLSALNTEWTDRNQALEASYDEIRATQVQVINSQSLASVGQLTAAISHEIAAPLEQVAGNMSRQQALLDQMGARPDLQALPEVQRDVLAQLSEAAHLSRMALDRVSALMGSLRSFSRPDRADAAPADLNECLKSVVLLTSNLWKRRIRMRESYGELPLFPFHPGLIGQVVINLVVNAVHAIEEEGEIEIRTWQEGGTACFSVRDTGTGIPPDILPHIFEFGYTTKGAGKGSGLGLAICVEILHQHEGDIAVDSTPGSGTVFTVSLPMEAVDAAGA